MFLLITKLQSNHISDFYYFVVAAKFHVG